MFKHTNVLATVIGIALLGGCTSEEPSEKRARTGHQHASGTGHKAAGHDARGGHVEDADQDFLPGRVKSAFIREFHGATIQDVEKQTHADGEVHWEIRFTDKDGAPRTAEFDTDGKLVDGQ